MMRKLNQNPLKNDMRKQRLFDLVFVFVFLAAAACFVLTAPLGITSTDEVQYQFVCCRLMAGEKLFADNWLIVGMQPLFQYLPFRIFYALLGGVDGIVLAMRYLYIAVKLIFFVYIYCRLRKYTLWAVFAAAFFAGTDLFGIKTISYYSICPQCILLVGMLLFYREDARPVHWILAGFFLSCGVLVFPPVAAVWLLYCCLTAVRHAAKKRGKPFLAQYDYVLSPRVWRWMLVGICAAAILFFILCALFFTGTDLRAILVGLRSISGFFGDGPLARMSFLAIRASKLKRYLRFMHPALVILTAAAFAGGLIVRRKAVGAQRFFFVALCVLCAAIAVRLLLLPYTKFRDASGDCSCHPLLLAVPALQAYVFTKNKDRRLFGFLLLAIAVSFVADVYSMNALGAFLLPGCVPSVLLLRAYYLEQRTRPAAEVKKKTGKSRKSSVLVRNAWGIAVCALFVLFPVLEAGHYVYMARLYETERLLVQTDAPLDAKIETGILKGVVTTREIKDNYDKSVRDAETCRRMCKNALFVIDYDTSVYVNAGCPVSTPFLHYLTADYGREEAWWALHPDKRPDVVYIPFFTLSYISHETMSAQEYLQYFREHADITVTEGEIGYFVRIRAWNT